ncbi:MAG: hypothetical protein JF606_24595, partial [Burkholderiales bacterium]|nr:hypothetical protein [Burkholderiales bacterium]
MSPQRDGQSNRSYARRLHSAHPQLTSREVSQLSGVTESNLRRDPAFRTQPADLVRPRPDIADEARPTRRQRLGLIQDTRSAESDLAIDIERQQQPLSHEIGRWLREGENEVPGGIADFDQEANARSFARVLNRIMPRARGRDGEELRRQGDTVIKAIASDAALRAEVFTMATNALGTCRDNVAEGFSNIVNAVANHQMAEDVKSGKIGPAELHKWSGQQFRLDALEGAVHRFIR